EIRRRRVREVTFSNLALHEERQLYTVDKYFQDEEAEPSYQMAGKEITPKLLLEAIRALPEERRKIVLLYYFEGLTDMEIGKQLNISRSTVQYRRTSSFEQLKKYLEENADEWIEW
ncbi:TPA: RNA polymerase sigma factor, partial [Enterococcus faecium]